METIGRNEIRILSEQMLAACQEIAAKHGLTAKADGGQYSGAAATCKMRFEVPAMADLVSKRDAELLGANFGVGHVFVNNGQEFKVTGFSLRRPKYPVSAVSTSTGKGYKFPVQAVKA